MASHGRTPPADAATAFVSWLVTAGGGPAVAALPVNLVAHKLATAAVRWFKRFRQTDDLSRLVKAAAGASFQLSRDEIRDLGKLLEKEQTWQLLAVGRLDEKLEELTSQIAYCLAARDGRTAEQTHAGAEAIARGLLEFAVFELEPEIFQKVVLARLQQMSDHASALDEALFRMHKDLYHLVGEARDLFTLVSDRLPPGRADLNEVKIYLTTLIGWLNADQWPQRLGGPTLTPAAIERELRVSATGPVREQEADADELARQCSRLVIRGGPGSGKTWLAMRTARICAEEALAALEAGTTLDEVELPLYTTCSRLVSAPAGVGIREAVASSAIARIGDLGGSRILTALCLLFTEGDRRTLLVIDSLDEARDAGEARDRLREADSLRPPWRVVLTTRHSSWDNQLNIQNANPTHWIGDLQPLRYPADVEAVIQQWFANSRPHGQALVNAIAGRPGLQQAATVPLVLAFYCILGDPPLPAFRHELYGQVIDRMLRSLWHRGGGRPPDLGACRAVLLTWAWPGVKENHPVSGVGQWEDDIPTEDVSLSPAGQIAVDHIAAPSGGPGFDADEILRRFVHRSLREHLVAENVASLPAEQAVQELLPHLWYDPDWEYTAPAALAMHPQRGWVLKELIRRVAGGDQLPADLAQIDGCWEIRRFLARVAQESGEGAWPDEAAEMIRQARLDLTKSRHDNLPLVVASGWPTSNGLIIESLLGRLAGGAGLFMARELVGVVARLPVTAEERAQARQALLALLTGETEPWVARELAEAVTQLAVTVEERAQARQALLALLTGGTERWVARELAEAVTRLAVTAEERAQARQALLALLTGGTEPSVARELAEAVTRLAVTAEERAQARQALLALLTGETKPWRALQLADTLAGLDPPAPDRAQASQALLALLTGETERWLARELAEAVAGLDPPAPERAQARQALLALLTGGTERWVARELAEAVTRLAVTVEERAQARQALLALLTGGTERWLARELAEAVAGLDPPAPERAQARQALLALLTGETNSERALQLADTLARLDPPAPHRAQARQALLALLTGGTEPSVARELAEAVTRLAVTAEERAQARQALLALLTGETEPWSARELAEAVAGLDPPAPERAQARQALLALLTGGTERWVARELAEAVTRLAVTVEERAQARQALLALLTGGTEPSVARELAEAVTRLAVTAEERAQARQALLALLTGETKPWTAQELVDTLAGLDPPAPDRAQASQALLALLTGETEPWRALQLVDTLAGLDPPAPDRAQASQALLALLTGETEPRTAQELVDTLARLDAPAPHQAQASQALLALLTGETKPWRAQSLVGAFSSAQALFAAARRNSQLSAWLAALPLLSESVHTAAESDAARQNSQQSAWLVAALPPLSESVHTAAESDDEPTTPNNG